MFVEKLTQLCDEKKIVSIYDDIDQPDRFALGYIVSCNREHYVLALISPDGKYDGFLLKICDKILHISYDGQYENKIKKLVRYYKTEHEKYRFAEDDLVKEMLLFAKKYNFIVSIELNNSGYDDCVGYIKEFNNNKCVIQNIDSYGNGDGESFMLINDITQISCNSSDEISLKILHENEHF